MNDIRQNKKSSNPRKDSVIRSLLAEGLEPEITMARTDLTQTEAFDLEKHYIAFYGRRGIDSNGTLTNLLEGGIGGSIGGTKDHRGDKNPNWGRKHPGLHGINQENHPLKGKTGQDHPSFGRKHSEETKRKIAQLREGITYEEKYGVEKAATTRAKKSESMKGKNKRPCSPETRAKISETKRRKRQEAGLQPI